MMKSDLMNMRKTAVFILLIISCIFTSVFFSCASRMSDSEARVILADLIPLSQELNRVFWGDGIQLENEDAIALDTVTTAQYYPVSDDCPYRCVADMKAAAEKVFSLDYLESVYTMLFLGLDEAGIEPRFADNDDGLLTVDICFETYSFNTEIYPETAVVKESGAGLINIEVGCMTGGELGKMNITLRQQNGEWRIDSPTY